jgi:hypothetical protein
MTPRAPPYENHIPPDDLRCDSIIKRVPAVPRKRMKLSGYDMSFRNCQFLR